MNSGKNLLQLVRFWILPNGLREHTFVEHLSRLLIRSFRWSVTHFTFGHSIGFVDAECDVDGIIAALHSMAIMTGLISALP